MPLQKQNLALPFSTSLDQKTDPLQVLPTSLLSLANAVYTKDKRLTKRNGFANLSSLPEGSSVTTITTFNENLTAVGNTVLAYNEAAQDWVDRGRFQSVQLDTIALARSSHSQTRVDTAIASNGWVCSTFTDSTGAYYQVSDGATSQLLVNPTALESTATSVRTYVLGNYFVITYLATITATPTLRYVALPLSTLIPIAPDTISSQVKSINHAYDAVVQNDVLYIAWAGSDLGEAVRFTRLSASLSTYTTKVLATGTVADLMSVTSTQNYVWVTWYQDSDTSVWSTAMNLLTVEVLAPSELDDSLELVQLASSAQGTTLTVLGQVDNDYSYEAIRTDYISKLTCTTAGTVTGPTTIVRSVGLGSKTFIVGDVIYFLGAYQSAYQSSYFLIDSEGSVVAKLAYANGGGYVEGIALPSVNVSASTATVGYLYKALITSTAEKGNVYTQTGVNLATFDLSSTNLITAEIGENLHIAGGFVWMYDGALCAEHNFHVWPEDLEAVGSSSTGTMSEQAYRYVAVYEWTDAQGNIHRSAPSLPAAVTLGAGEDTVTVNIPTLRLTYKTDVRIVLYRWSTAQQSYYQTTSITSPLLNDPTVDSVSYVDLLPDASILGNPLVYTTGGVVENIAFPAAKSIALYKSRLMVLSAENRNEVWYSKPVVQGVPAEPSDLLTMFISPTIGAQGSTGQCSVLSAMDDKFLIAKKGAWYYVTGDGPNNLGQQNDFSEPTFITAVVGCENQASIALVPQGLMFQSDKGIWILGRDLSTNYIGAPVEDYNSDVVTSAVVVPGTNQVRFCLDNNQALMFDYYYGRWGTFNNIPAISSTLFEGMHTYLTSSGLVRQERVGYYQDGSSPVLLSWETAWINVAGLQGLERVYCLYILGSYISPHKLAISIAYDYQNNSAQTLVITPDNYAGLYGDLPIVYGQGDVFGGAGSLEQWQVYFNKQKVQSVKVTVQEMYDSSLGGVPGAGLTFSGLNFEIGLKKGSPTLRASRRAS